MSHIQVLGGTLLLRLAAMREGTLACRATFLCRATGCQILGCIALLMITGVASCCIVLQRVAVCCSALPLAAGLFGPADYCR